MEELKELRLNTGVLILDRHRVISPIIPQSYREIDNDVLVKGEAYVDGAVYARKLDVDRGPFTVCGALFAKECVTAAADNDTTLDFRKAVACGGKIDLGDKGRKYFGADLNGSTVRLRNAVVAANVFGSEVSLENCIVLGGVFSTKSLRLDNCVVGTFNSPSAAVSGDCYLLCPSVFTVEPLHVGEGARLFNLTLADWGALLKGVPEAEHTGVIEIDPKVDEQKISLKDAQGNMTLWETYSVAGKVLAADLIDLKKLDNHFLLSAGTLGEQLIKQYDYGCDRSGKPIKLTLETIGNLFRDIQSGTIKVRPIDGKVSFEELKKFYSED